MAYGYACVHCGHEEGLHDPNLVNEPGNDDGTDMWFESTITGYEMDILSCMATPWTASYKEAVHEAGLMTRRTGRGYVSPDLQAESAEQEEKLNNSRYINHSVLMLFYGGGRSFVVDIGS